MWKRKLIRSGVKNSIIVVVDVRWASMWCGDVFFLVCVWKVSAARRREGGKKQLICTAIEMVVTKPISQQYQ
jgi:hypothetical protein